jgi:hypothetical protein
MDLLEKVKYLSELGESFPVTRKKKVFSGLIPVKIHDGWIAITEEKNCFSVMWTTERDSHNRHDGPALVIDLDKSDGTLYRRAGLSGAWKQALSLWPVGEQHQDEIKQIYDLMQKRIDIAYDWQRQKG